MSGPSVAVAIPAFDEADGIDGFLREIDHAHVGSLRLIVVNDASTDRTGNVLDALAPELQGELLVLTSERNRGHGSSLMAAYRCALVGEPDFVLQVDGDGQFHGSDLRRVLVLLKDEAHAVAGVRRFRQDPWFRMVMTRVVRRYVGAVFSVRARDPNCPLCGYETALLRDLLQTLPSECLVPNFYLTILAARRGVPLVEVDVSHRVRRGGAAQGTTWRGRAERPGPGPAGRAGSEPAGRPGSEPAGRPGPGPAGRAGPIPWRLVRFSFQALRESIRFRARIDR